MRLTPRLTGICLTSSVALLATQPTFANPTVMTGVRLNPGGSGLEMTLDTKGGSKPQVFAVTKGNSWQADITNARLQLPEGGSFSRQNPAPGIAAVSITPLDSNSVRVTVTGDKTTPVGQVTKRTEQGITISMTPPGATPAQPTGTASLPTEIPTVPATNAQPTTNNILAQAQPPAGSTPLVPNPKVTIDGTPVKPNPTPPFLPRAVPPPVGDIGVAGVDSSPFSIDLGTAERVPRLVVRDAPVREVLALLARAAGLNLAYTDVLGGPTGTTGGSSGGSGTEETPTVTLDIENEPVQDVFNYVLRIANLEANRTGRTIFVGSRLPDAARSVITRTLRLNQVSAEAASSFLTTQGAETRINVTRIRIETIGTPPNQRFVEIREPAIVSLRAEQGLGPLNLRGLSISRDDRLNSVTLIGNPRQVDLATSMLIQLDARQRQVAVNVRVVDVNLTDGRALGSSFSFGLDDVSVLNQGGIGVINFGGSRRVSPAQANITSGAVGLTALGTSPISTINAASNNNFNFLRGLILQLQASIVAGNAKILTDPTLIVQEKQQSTVRLTEEVISNVEITVTPGTPPTVSTTVEKEEAGLILNLVVDRIDDNGFVTLQINPDISGIQDTRQITVPSGVGTDSTITVTLLQRRQIQSGLVRLRDGQTLVLTGIIRDSDRSTAQKIPILGDLPLLGSLFRRTQNERTRNEVVVLVTPRILDDSDRSTFGYGYQLSPETQRLLDRRSPSFIAPDPAPPSRQ